MDSKLKTQLMSHDHLLKIVVRKSQDYVSFGDVKRDGEGNDDWFPDCSSGCAYFAILAGALGSDWGVCTNESSHRSGLLTFEHQGCTHFQPDPDPKLTLRQISDETLEVVTGLLEDPGVQRTEDSVYDHTQLKNNVQGRVAINVNDENEENIAVMLAPAGTDPQSAIAKAREIIELHCAYDDFIFSHVWEIARPFLESEGFSFIENFEDLNLMPRTKPY